jgi:ABC-type lipoprotein release transport system permease subunit
MIIIIVSFTLSTISGNFIANRIGNTILGYQKITDVASDYDSYKLALKYFENISSDELLANYQIDINLVTYLQLYGFSILIVVLSTAIPTSFIVMIDPKKIMSN